MKKRVLSLCSGVTLGVLLSGKVSGQTPPPPPATPISEGTPTVTATTAPTPTVTAIPTPTVPPGSALIAAMKAAAKGAGSVHFAGTVVVEIPKFRRVSELVNGDISWARKALKLSGTATTTRLDVTPTKSSRSPLQYVAVGNVYANQGKKGKWTCTTSKTEYTKDAVLVAGFLNASSSGAINLGAAAINGVPVWHVRAPQPSLLDDNLPKGTHMQADLYISQRDGALAREKWNVTASPSGISLRESASLDYSKFGEPLTIKLPAQCAKPATRTGRAVSLPSLFGPPRRLGHGP